MQLLADCGVPYKPSSFDIPRDPANWLRALAIAGRDDELCDWVCFWKDAGRLDSDEVCRLLIPLAKGGHRDAIQLLIDEGIDPRPAIEHLADGEDIVAMRHLLVAEESDSALFDLQFSRSGSEGRIGIDRLSSLLRAGADPSHFILERFEHPKIDLHAKALIAKVMIAAGARSEDTLRLLPPDKRAEVAELFDRCSRDVATVAREVMRTQKSPDATLVEDILLAQYAKACGYHAPLQAVVGEFAAAQKDWEANLLRTVLEVKWESILKQIRYDTFEASGVVVRLLESPNALPFVRLMVQAGADMVPVVDKILGTYAHDEARALELIAKLIPAGFSAHGLLERLIDTGALSFAEKLVKGKYIDIMKVFKELVGNGDIDTLKKLIPLHRDIDPLYLMMSDPKGGAEPARTLLAAGADATAAFLRADHYNDGTAMRQLLDLGLDKSLLLGKVLSQPHFSTAIALTVLGCDPDIAFTHVTPGLAGSLRTLVTNYVHMVPRWGAEWNWHPMFRIQRD